MTASKDSCFKKYHLPQYFLLFTFLISRTRFFLIEVELKQHKFQKVISVKNLNNTNL